MNEGSEGSLLRRRSGIFLSVNNFSNRADQQVKTIKQLFQPIVHTFPTPEKLIPMKRFVDLTDCPIFLLSCSKKKKKVSSPDHFLINLTHWHTSLLSICVFFK